ncbi:MAG TPA: uridine kinase [Haloplasmataceae bacterium]
MKSILIGIAGGTASGKTLVTEKIKRQFSEDCVTVIKQDDYYKDQSDIPFEERLKVNYDHPDAIDMDLLYEHLKALLDGAIIEKPTYDFTRHTRSERTETIHPTRIIIVEGIMVLYDPRLRQLMDIKLYVDTDADIRFIRRLLRDIKERGRSIDSVVTQYTTTVKPMHNQFVEPTKRYADLIIPEGGNNRVAIDIISTKIKQLIFQIEEE